MLEYTAYEGEHYTIEWFFDSKKKSPALEYYRQLADSERIEILKLFKRMGDSGELKIKQNLIMKVIKFSHLNLNLRDFSVFSFGTEKL